MSSAHPRIRPVSNERGIVLAAALLFVLLTSVLVLTFMTTTTGERSQSSNVQTAKLALYSADAGVRTQQQLLANLAKAKIDSCVVAWTAAGGIGNIVTQPAQMFPAGVLSGVWAASATNPPFSASANITWVDCSISSTSQTYNYQFTIQSTGTVGNTGRRSVQSQGMLRVSATRGEFTDYLLFMDQFMMSNGSNIWFTSAGNFDGRVHTNTGFKFAYKPTFQDQVTQHDANATFYNDGNAPVVADASSNGSIDVPNFYGGYLRGQAAIPLPGNSYDQQEAALGLPQTGSAPSNSTIKGALGLSGGGPPPNGVYVPNNGIAVNGGIYIQGNADQMKMWADTLTKKQYYQVVQGGATRTIEIDRVGNTTNIWNSASTSGSPTSTYSGVPPNGVVYSTGSINDLKGPDRGANSYVNPAVAVNNRWLITAASDIVINGDLTCDDYNGSSNVLGIFSSNGQVRIGGSAPDNLSIDAFVMATGLANGQFCVDNWNSGSSRGSVNLRGGVVSKFYGAFYTFDAQGNVATGFGRNFHYDGRGLTPPFFPKTNRFVADQPSARTIAWKEI